MRKTSLFASLLCILISTCALGVGGDMGVGTEPLTDGSETYPYLIEDLADFDTFADPINAATYWAGVHTKLMTDIDLSGRIISPVGNSTTHFTGMFDGNGHKVSNLAYTTSEMDNPVGLFGYTDFTIITNLGVENIDIHAEFSVAGGLVGFQNYGTITDCYTTGSVTASTAGGLVGEQYSGEIINSYSTCSISFEDVGAGLVGRQSQDNSLIFSCYSAGSVTSLEYSFESYAGGLVGWQDSGNIAHCYSTSAISVVCSAEGQYSAGGLVGLSWGSVNYCYSTGSVTSNGDPNFIGGLIGEGNMSGFNSFWDTQASGLSHSAGGRGRTTLQMQQADNYIGWNTAGQVIWTIDEGFDYPKLAWQNSPGIALPAQTLGSFLPGTGTSSNPYRISTAEQFSMIGLFLSEWDQFFLLENDIDFSGITSNEFNKIGINSNNAFTGTFDGNGHVISNFTYVTDKADHYVGLFGYAENAVIKNVGLENATVSTSGNHIGGLVGLVKEGTITNCYCIGQISGQDYIGGLLGLRNLTSITNCYSKGSVTGCDYIGGLVGNGYLGTITSSYSMSNVVGCDQVGGLIGYTYNVYIYSSYSMGNVSGENYLGGLVGEQYIVNQYSGLIANCYSTGSITSMNAGHHLGGLTGVGGNVLNSFWDTQSSGIDYSGGGKGRTTEQMKQSTNYIAWNSSDQTTWTLDEGNDYPRLVWEEQSGTPLPTQVLGNFISGAGTEADPYHISTVEQLNVIGLFPDQLDKVYRLENDIDMSDITGAEFNKIGAGGGSYRFRGRFEGNGHVISNFTYITEGAEYYVGLFGRTYNCIIKNLGMKNVHISTTGCNIGGLIGSHEGSSADVISCYTTGYVTGVDYVGGLVGSQYDSTITSCYSTVNVTGDEYLGGLVGRIGSFGNFTMITSYSTGRVIGNSRIGGLLGYRLLDKGTITSCFWDNQTSGLVVGVGYGSPEETIGKTTAEMMTQSTFTGWDFLGETANGTDDIWRMCVDGVDYPRLWHEFRDTDFVCYDGVDMVDFAYLAGYWELTGCDSGTDCGRADIDGGGDVGLGDLACVAEDWLK